jgi:hypothetical protein
MWKIQREKKCQLFINVLLKRISGVKAPLQIC